MSHSSDDTADVDVIEVVTRVDIMCSASDARGDIGHELADPLSVVVEKLVAFVSWFFVVEVVGSKLDTLVS